jgi:hypothetical protein
MLSPKSVLLFLLSKSFFGFFLSTGFLFRRSALISELSLSSFSKATQAAVYSMLMCCEIVIAYKTRKKDLQDLYS